MTLSAGRGPLSNDPLGRFVPPIAPDSVFIEPHPRRVQALVGDDVVIDTELALMVHRAGHALSYAFLVDDVVGLAPALAEATKPVVEAPGYVTVAWDAVDAWYEEGRRLVHYPPNPYHRVDCRPTARRLLVEVGGPGGPGGPGGSTVLVDTTDTTIVFETAVDTKLYVSKDHVRMDLLRQTETSSYCNYKGYATYWSAFLDGEVFEDVAWSYEDPLPESLPIAGMLSFYPDRVQMTADIPTVAVVTQNAAGIVCDC